MDNEYLATLRRNELESVLALLAKHGVRGGRLLEIGAGTGEQARALSARGYDVTAIDLEGSRYASDRVWPVIDYDGSVFPFEDNSFDIVFSSNVLEHVAHTEHMQREISRVLVPDGIVVHVLPSAAWRVLTMLVHYPWLVKVTAQAILGRRGSGRAAPGAEERSGRFGGVRAALWRRVLYANRHGEHGNALNEAFYFRRARWVRVFTLNGFRVVGLIPSGFLYSGYALFGHHLSIPVRKRMAALFGSACHVFVLRRCNRGAKGASVK